jgi:CBS domain-containing membrane protein
MAKRSKGKDMGIPNSVDITDEDVYDAMKEIPGYLDITPGDFKEVYRHAYRRAVERLKRSIKAKDVMTRDVVFVDIKTPMKEVAQALGSHGISGLPVVDLEGKVVGVISEKDFLRHMGAQDKMTFMAFVAERLKEAWCVDESIGERTAGEMMTSPAVTIDENKPVIEIATLFKEKNINRAPVINQQGGLVGLVSRADIIESTIL